MPLHASAEGASDARRSGRIEHRGRGLCRQLLLAVVETVLAVRPAPEALVSPPVLVRAGAHTIFDAAIECRSRHAQIVAVVADRRLDETDAETAPLGQAFAGAEQTGSATRRERGGQYV